MENELITISTKRIDGEEISCISARELHEFLEIGTRFDKWFGRMCEYGFNENNDFVRVAQKCPTLGGTQTKIDYIITLDMAKEISMIQRTPKGKQARQYFIQCEKKLKEVVKTPLQNSEIDNRIERLENTIESLVGAVANLTKVMTSVLTGEKNNKENKEEEILEPEIIPHGFFKFDWENDFNYEGLIIPIEFILNVRNWYVIDNEVNKDRVSRDRIYKTRSGEFYVSKMFIVSFVQKYKRDNNKQKTTTNSQGKKIKNNNKFGKKKEIVQYLKNIDGTVKEVLGVYEGVTDAHVKTGYGLTSISSCVSGAVMYAFKNHKGERIYWDYIDNFEAKYPDYKL